MNIKKNVLDAVRGNFECMAVYENLQNYIFNVLMIK